MSEIDETTRAATTSRLCPPADVERVVVDETDDGRAVSLLLALATALGLAVVIGCELVIAHAPAPRGVERHHGDQPGPGPTGARERTPLDPRIFASGRPPLTRR